MELLQRRLAWLSSLGWITLLCPGLTSVITYITLSCNLFSFSISPPDVNSVRTRATSIHFTTVSQGTQWGTKYWKMEQTEGWGKEACIDSGLTDLWRGPVIGSRTFMRRLQPLPSRTEILEWRGKLQSPHIWSKMTYCQEFAGNV